MAREYKKHSLKINAWAETATPGLSPSEIIDLFESATAKIWSRSYTTIGDVTLVAVADRALFNGSSAYKILLPLRVDTTGIRWQGFRRINAKLSRAELIGPLVYFITEFVAIASSITGEILAAPLYQELDAIILKKKKK
jgi:hypothetical protein